MISMSPNYFYTSSLNRTSVLNFKLFNDNFPPKLTKTGAAKVVFNRGKI